MTKKWVGGQQSSSSLATAKQTRIYSAVNVDTPTTTKNYPNHTTQQRALQRTRNGGSTVPKKVSQKHVNHNIVGTPTVTSATMDNYILSVTYTPPPDSRTGYISFYQYSIDAGRSWVHVGVKNPFTISGLTNGQPYKIQVRACNNHVVSDPSPEYSFIAVKQLPSSLVATRLLWLDATDSTTVEKSGDNVVVWKDKTEFGNHFTTSSAIKYSDTITTINNRPAIHFPTYSLTMSNINKTFNVDDPFTLFCVVDHTVLSGQAMNSEIFLAGDQYKRFDLFSKTQSGGTNMLSVNAGYVSQLDTGNYIIGNGADLISVVITAGSAGTCTVYVNGNTTTLNGSPKYITGDPTYVGLNGTYNWRISGAGFIGYMGEFVTYRTNFDNANREKMEGYLAWKWGINDKLPANHPYKTIPPP